MNSKLPSTRKTASVQDRLSRRIVDSYDRAENTATALYGGSDPTALQVNPYATAAIDDDFRPGTPDEWLTGAAPGDDALFIERAHLQGSPLKSPNMAMTTLGGGANSSLNAPSAMMTMGSTLGAPITEGVATLGGGGGSGGAGASMAHTTGSFPGSLF